MEITPHHWFGRRVSDWAGGGNDTASHDESQLLLAQAADELSCKMQFFIHPRYSSPIHQIHRYALPIYTIKLGRNPSRIYYTRARGHAFTYSDDHKKDGFDGVMSEHPVRIT